MSDKRKDMDPAMATCQGEKKESRKAAQREGRERGEGGRRAAYDNADDDNDNDDYEPSTMIAFAESETMPVPPLDFCFPLFPLCSSRDCPLVSRASANLDVGSFSLAFNNSHPELKMG